MEGFSYTDIFATKGMEYLVIIAFLSLLIPFTLVLNRNTKVRRRIHAAVSGFPAEIQRIPQGLLFNRNHTWMFLDRSGTARMGLDSMLPHLTGDVKFVAKRSPGETVRRGEVLAEMEQDGKRLHIFSPLSGTVVASNGEVETDPAIVQNDPYGDGWMFRIRPENWLGEIGQCVIATGAKAWLAGEWARFREFLTSPREAHGETIALSVLQDGGEPADRCLARLPEDSWKEFQQEFLSL